MNLFGTWDDLCGRGNNVCSVRQVDSPGLIGGNRDGRRFVSFVIVGYDGRSFRGGRRGEAGGKSRRRNWDGGSRIMGLWLRK